MIPLVSGRGILLVLAILLASGFTRAETLIGGDFELTDHHGQPFSLTATRGKVTLLFFGYTSCPDICPITLTEVSSILKTLGTRADEIAPIFISVDPQRDMVERLAQYIPWYDKRLIGLTGTQHQIDAVTDAYHVQVQLNRKSPDDMTYTVDHSAGLFLIDRAGRLTQIIPFGLPREHSLRAIEDLLDQ
ncbi:MAG: SCO family protein [Gammaproteobacteria bacterium]|nr:SCO family protein [Gammaproteobacteria bacterium]